MDYGKFTTCRVGSKNAGYVVFPGGAQILFSYATPVAVKQADGAITITADARRTYSASTARHIDSWLRDQGWPDHTSAGKDHVNALAVEVARFAGLGDVPAVDFSRPGAEVARQNILQGLEDVECGILQSRPARSVTRRDGTLNKVSRGWIENARQ